MNSMILRHFHVGRILWSPAVEKSLLSKLRKSTGYSFSKCKEALEKHENDLKEAESWLKSQAQAHGWEKATKLSGRATAQGLISILAKNSNAVMVETNCETDFVARNKKFQSLVQRVTQGVFQYSTEQPAQSGNTLLSSITLTSEQLTNLPLPESRAVKDETAISIGELGENIQNRRSICFNVTTPVRLATYTHPLPEDGPVDKNLVQYGRYGVIVAYRPTGGQPTKSGKKDLNEVGRQLCQHIVGMSPTEIGTLRPRAPPVSEEPVEETLTVEKKEEVENKPEVGQKPAGKKRGGKKAAAEQKSDEEYLAAEEEEDRMCSVPVQDNAESDEMSLLNQEFLLDPDLTVGEYLLEHEVEVLEFVRFEVGESIEASQHG